MATHSSILAWRILCILLLQKLFVSMKTLQQKVPGPRSEMGQGSGKAAEATEMELKTHSHSLAYSKGNSTQYSGDPNREEICRVSTCTRAADSLCCAADRNRAP